MKQFALFLVLMLILCGCTPTTPPISETVPSETTVPPATSPPALAADPAEYQAMLSPHDGGQKWLFVDSSILDNPENADLYNLLCGKNWLFFATGCLFDKPENVDLYHLFYGGLGYASSWDSISEESQQALIDGGFWRDMDIQVMPAASLETILEFYFGVQLDDVTIPDHWQYLPKEDVYCSNHNDAFFPALPTVTDVNDDGSTVTIRYCVDFFFNNLTGEYLDASELLMTLQRQDGGTMICLSNVIAP